MDTGDLRQRPGGLGLAAALGTPVAVALLIACGPNGASLEATIDARVQEAFAGLPTATAQASITPQPTATPQPTVTPQSIPVPAPTATRVPDPTPQPTATPVVFPTPLPTATAAATPTPAPTATPVPTATPATFVPSFADVYNRVRLGVVEIRHGTTIGTGWAIEDGWIITNEHVVESASTVSVRIPLAPSGSRTLTGIVRGRDARRDLAAIQVDHGLKPLPRRVIGTTDGGLAVIQIGYSTGVLGYPAAKLGVVTAVFGFSGAALSTGISSFDPGASGATSGISIVVTDAAADPGDSGGPVIDSYGAVVGTIFGSIVFSGDKRVTGQQQAIGVKDINAVWPDLKRGIDTSSR